MGHFAFSWYFLCIYLKTTNYVENRNIEKNEQIMLKNWNILFPLFITCTECCPRLAFPQKHLHFILDLGYYLVACAFLRPDMVQPRDMGSLCSSTKSKLLNYSCLILPITKPFFDLERKPKHFLVDPPYML